MPSLVILGAGGFLGKAIIAQKRTFRIKAVARKIPADVTINSDKTIWYESDLLIPKSLDGILEEDDIVINTAYIESNNENDNLCMIDNIIAACVQNKVKRLIHCSTANVVGAAKNLHVDESVICKPTTEYERVKFLMEQRLLSSRLTNLEMVILRPTAIVGPGGKNLLKLANSLINGNKFVNYLRASLFGKRKMNLVPIQNVVAAILHLSTQQEISNGAIYFISSDDDPENNFFSIEKMLLEALGLRHRKIPLIPIPRSILSMMIKFKGRSGEDSSRVYDSNQLIATGYIPEVSLQTAIKEFGKIMRIKHITGSLLSDN